MMKKKIPKFETDDEEREFRATHDSTEYVDWEAVERIRFPNLKPFAKTNSELVAEYAEDLAAFEQRAEQTNLRFEDVVKDLEQRGKM